MAKRKENETEGEVISSTEQTVTDPIYNIESFVEEHSQTKSHISGKAFEVWYVSQGGSKLDKKTMSKWETLLKTFLNEEVKL